MPIYANHSAIFRQWKYENQFCQIIWKSGRILRIKKRQNLWKLVNSSLQIENEDGFVFNRGCDFCILRDFSVHLL